MKRKIVFLLLMTLSLNVVVGQTPENLMTKFKTDYPRANAVEWKMAGERHSVSFTDEQNLQHLIVYNSNGSVYSMESELDEAKVPASINEYYRSNFPQQKEGRVWLLENADGSKSYYSPIDDAVLFFDNDGKFNRLEPRKPEIMQPKK
jgi:hypothetical protein